MGSAPAATEGAGGGDAARHAAAGALSGAAGTALGQPFDAVKVALQARAGGAGPGAAQPGGALAAARGLVREGGVRALFRGLGPPLVSLTLINSLNFTCYEGLRQRGLPPPAAGALVGLAAAVVSTPSELLKVRQQLLGVGAVAEARRLWAWRGPRGLYLGHAVNVARESVFLSVFFGTYAASRGALEGPVALPSSLAVPLSGGLSGAAGWLVSLPLDTVKSNVQGQALPCPGKPPEGALAVLRRVLAGPGGLAALYEGAAPAVARAFVVSSTRFSAYEAALWALGGVHASGGLA